MKNILIAVCILLGALAAQAEPMARLVSYNVNRPRFLAPKLAKGETISYCTYLSKDGLTVTTPEDFDKTLRLALKLWTVYPAYLIRRAGREQEFAPVLKALEQNARLERLPACDFSAFDKKYLKLLNPQPAKKPQEKADVSFFFENNFFAKMNNMEKISSYFSLNPIPHMLITNQVRQNHAIPATWGEKQQQKTALFNDLRERILKTPASDHAAMTELMEELTLLLRAFGYSNTSLLYTVLHEMGHAVGLADQHKWINNDKIYSTLDPRQSVMDYATTFLTCDDADGVITLFDDALGIKRTFKSLCGDGISFEDGKELLEKDKSMETSTRNYQITRTYHPDTKTTGIYDWKERLYVNLNEDSAKEINEHFDLSLMKEKWGGYQISQGQLKFIDLEDTGKGSYAVGEHYTRLTIGPGTLYKQVLWEHYDDEGNLLDYTLEIYDTETDTVAKTRQVQVKK